jgi:DNA-binding MarR family transcriptional regulator
MSKNSRNELIGELVTAVRASQTATEMLDAAIADYLGVNDTDFRCLDILDQEGPMTAGRLARRARLSPGAMTTLLDRLERRGLARRVRDSDDRRKVLVEVTPKLREMGAELYGSPEEASAGLNAYSDEELELLIGFMRAGVAFQEEKMRRLDELSAARARAAAGEG